MRKLHFTCLLTIGALTIIVLYAFWEQHQTVGIKYPRQDGSRVDSGGTDELDTPIQTGPCPSLSGQWRILDPPSPNIWQTVHDRVFYVYSAHADPRMGNATLIRIFGIMPLDRRLGPLPGETFWCQIWKDIQAPSHVTEATLYNQGHAKEQYLSAQWSCVLNTDPEHFSARAVSLVVNDSCAEPRNVLAIHRVTKTDSHTSRFTICIGGVLKREYSNYHQLVEWIEVNRMFGADRIVGYDYNSSRIIEPYVDYYRKSGILELIPWTLPDIGDVDSFHVIWNLGQITAINDCIYRNMYTSLHVACLDLDEIIVPYGKSRTWLEMMRNAGCGDKPIAIVRNAFFGISAKWPEDDRYKDNKLVHDVLRLVTLTRTKQDKYVNFFPKRSKFITRSEAVDTAGIHNIKKVWGVKNRDRFVCEVKLPFGRLHHYRDPRWEDIEPLHNTFMYRYAEDIINRTADVHKTVLGIISLE